MNLVENKDFKMKILLVDDDPEFLDILKRISIKLGFDPVLAKNGVEAMKKMRSDNFLIVISDIQMPEMNGLDLLKKIKEISPPTHVIMVTGYQTTLNVLSAMNRGADACLFKPLESTEVVEHAILRAVEMIQDWRNILSVLAKMKRGSNG